MNRQISFDGVSLDQRKEFKQINIEVIQIMIIYGSQILGITIIEKFV